MNTPSPTPTEIAKPCPFCGYGDDPVEEHADGKLWILHGPDDSKCPLEGSMIPLEEWNRRAPALAPFEKLVEEWRAVENPYNPEGEFAAEGEMYRNVYHDCADRLSAVVEEVRGKK